jgi:cytochrome c oxidase subunit 2
MKCNRTNFRAISFVAAVMILAGIISLPAQQNGAVREIQVTAKKYEFDPSVITVKQGEQVKLIITSQDTTHGFALKAYGINKKLAKGKPVTVEFTANKAGSFPFRCSVFCGMGHRRMKGMLIVKPASGATGQ